MAAPPARRPAPNPPPSARRRSKTRVDQTPRGGAKPAQERDGGGRAEKPVPNSHGLSSLAGLVHLHTPPPYTPGYVATEFSTHRTTASIVIRSSARYDPIHEA